MSARIAARKLSRDQVSLIGKTSAYSAQVDSASLIVELVLIGQICIGVENYSRHIQESVPASVFLSKKSDQWDEREISSEYDSMHEPGG